MGLILLNDVTDIVVIIMNININNTSELINGILYRWTSPLEHLCPRDTSIQGTQNLARTNIHVIFLSITSVETTPLFGKKEKIFLKLFLKNTEIYTWRLLISIQHSSLKSQLYFVV